MKNFEKISVALGFDPEKDNAPTILAGGTGLLADMIRNLAEKNDIPVQKDKNLAEFLIQIPEGQEIPAKIYEAVAKIFAFIWKLEKELPDKHR
ncbi:MAG TPA: EscU/YscU/HrcU family type III secretion system export apparatus switch protein [Leptospiraceae bacterium]|nr:EscU/YscU/HrcU family type III secretion system export apparatus switch protein [Leptospiraceae bacterium]HMY68845.1 EscU/YscU/HrcU family type III secretion system export apparatus switch protein [Leptospiraceae bacterium]HMZ57549.1 EscU/YscU/HrcU family type III secretion system export apparatus switch protein [Leptospiraceae bacterium]HNF15186.1 EscU/YscU/HrcU family type III secretion system export apparatus switch protein [Leptospiraceae bacterium]HNF27070.1 EscU/YscU/HrcU family type I